MYGEGGIERIVIKKEVNNYSPLLEYLLVKYQILFNNYFFCN